MNKKMELEKVACPLSPPFPCPLFPPFPPFDKRGNKKKTPMFTEDYNEALTFAEYDIKSNWKIYKKAFLGKC